MAASQLPKKFDEENFDFYGRKLIGQPEQRARWKRCSNAVNGALGEALGQVYVEQFFAGDSKAKMLEMVHDIESAMGHDLDQLDWMSDIGLHLMGRNTYEEMAGFWPTSDDAYAAPMNNIPKVVFSKTLVVQNGRIRGSYVATWPKRSRR